MADRHVVDALSRATKAAGLNFAEGISQSKDSFYGEVDPDSAPSGEHLKERWEAWRRGNVMCSEMECAALFVISSIRGCRASAIMNWGDMNKTILAACNAVRLLIEQDAQEKGWKRIGGIMSKPIIELRNYKEYQYSAEDGPVLKNISCTINEGDFVGIVGCNRAGKSTLCKSIVGILPFVFGGEWDGEVVIDGNSLNETHGKGVMDVVGIVFQDAESQFTQQTVEDEIAFAMCNFGYDRKLMRERVKFAADACGLSNMLDRSPYRLSGGQQQRLAVACILALQPRVIILDESTSSWTHWT